MYERVIQLNEEMKRPRRERDKEIERESLALEDRRYEVLKV